MPAGRQLVLCFLITACFVSPAWPVELRGYSVAWVGNSFPCGENADSGQRDDREEKRRQPIEATRHVVRSVSRAARLNVSSEPAARRKGDELTDLYIQQAAREAAQLPKDIGPRAFLTGIAIALDDSDVLLKNPLTRNFCQAIESPAERAGRLEVLGLPTIRGRRDLAQHFVVSAGLTAEVGRLVADTAGLAKELMDAEGGSGFSFADLAADQAGIIFAERVLSGQFPLQRLAEPFSVADYLPDVAGLPEGLSSEAFQRDYAGGSSKRFDELARSHPRRVNSLPPYRSARPDARRPE